MGVRGERHFSQIELPKTGDKGLRAHKDSLTPLWKTEVWGAASV